MRSKATRGLALLLALLLILPAGAAAPAGNGVVPTYDEAYYALLDYYGNLTDGSVVKSYTLHGADSLTDYGVYDEVINLTDSSTPTIQNGTTVFQFDKAAPPDHFYFEGKTAAPFAALPWTLSITYKLNGVATPAEELAGKTGVVEITVDAVPNPAASEYAKNNYTMEVMTMFNQDDILSLEAPGAQVQLVGNLRAVLFVALPGEEQQFVIRVGTNDFSFAGLTFLMVPATLGQLSEIAKLGARKEELEDDYHQLSGSLDALLDSLTALSGSLRETAGGLDTLQDARESISNGKGSLYDDADRLLEDLKRLNGSLNLLPGHLDSTDRSVEEVADSMSGVSGAAVGLQSNFKSIDNTLDDLQDDIDHILSGSGSLDSNLASLGAHLGQLRTILGELQGANALTQAKDLETIWSRLAADAEGKPVSTITYPQYQVGAMIAGGSAETAEEAQALLTQVQAVDAAIAQVVQAGVPADQALSYLVAAGQLTQTQAETYTAAKTKLTVVDMVYQTVTGDDGSHAKTMTKRDFFTAMLMLKDITALENPAPQEIQAILSQKADYAKTGKVLAELSDSPGVSAVDDLLTQIGRLLADLGSGGLTGNLRDLLDRTDDTLDHLGDLAGDGKALSKKINQVLDQVEQLDDTIQGKVSGLQETLRDTRTLVDDMVTALDSTQTFLTSFRDLSEDAGSQLDEGTRQSLAALAETLRKTARSMDAAGDVRDAKGKINEIIEDTWNEYTGDVNHLLLMDANAPAVSLTSEENPSPLSVQILIRTQEIKTEEEDAAGGPAAQQAEPTTFWGRIAQMFQDFWNALLGLFH